MSFPYSVAISTQLTHITLKVQCLTSSLFPVTTPTEMPIFSRYINTSVAPNLLQHNPWHPACIVTILSVLCHLTSYNATPYEVTILIATLAFIWPISWATLAYPLYGTNFSGIPLSDIWCLTSSLKAGCPAHIKTAPWANLTLYSQSNPFTTLTELQQLLPK